MRSPDVRHPLLWLLAALVPLIAFTIGPAWDTIFSRFSLWDDEGYVMMSVASFLDGHALYDEVFSQYGPFYFLFKWAVFSAGDGSVTHDATRITTLAVWLASSVACAVLVMQRTRAVALSAAAYGLAFIVLAKLTDEPGHPQELGVLLVVLAMVASQVRHERLRAALLGATVAATLLVKINIGVLLGLAVVAAAGIGRARTRGTRLVSGPLALAVLLTPILLTRAHIGTVWGAAVALVATVSAGMTVWAARRAPRPSDVDPPGLGAPWMFIGAFTAVGVGTVAFVMARGTSAAGLADAVLLGPLAFSGRFFVADYVPLLSPLSLAASLVLACLYLGRWRDRLTARRLAVLRGGLGLLTAACVIGQAGAPELFFYVGPFVWLVVARPVEGPEPDFARRMLGFGPALQLLVLYPVASSQSTWATFLLIPLGVTCLADAWTVLRPRPAGWRARLGGLLLVYAAYAAWSPATDVHAAREERLFPVQGAGHIRMPAHEAGIAHWVVQNLRAHGRTFFSMPGQNSFYFWAGQEPPTTANHNYWMLLFDDSRQARLVEQFRRTDGLVILVCPVMVEAWRTFGTETGRAPLVKEIEGAWVTRLRRGGFELRAPAGDDEEWTEFLLFGSRPFGGDEAVPLPLEMLSGLEAGTLTGWLRTTTPGVVLGAQAVPPLDAPDGAHAALLSVGPAGELTARLDAGTPSIATTVSVADDRWHHWALDFGRRELKLYVDGQLVGRRLRAQAPAPLPFAQLGAGLGPGGWSFFSGELADIELRAHRSSAEEILARFQAGRRP